MQTYEKLIHSDDPNLQYMGRIDFADPLSPVFVYPCSSVTVRFTGKAVWASVTNLHSYYENSVGVILDGQQKKIILPDEKKEQAFLLFDNLPEGEHTLILYKRMDTCHYFCFHGFGFDASAVILPPPELPKRRMEVYGDSVSAGEVCEALDYVGKPDPQHNGVYSNSWYSYSWLTARRLNAQLHDIAQGGIALMKGTGYFCHPDLFGMEEVYDKIQCNPYLSQVKSWNFEKYTPHVVVVAIGQNDNHPDDFMSEDIENSKALLWRSRYGEFIRTLRRRYPEATIILSTTILNHNSNWDAAIDAVCKELADPKVHHFLYSNNGCGTPGHIRIPEAEKMAEELSCFIESLGEQIWEDCV